MARSHSPERREKDRERDRDRDRDRARDRDRDRSRERERERERERLRDKDSSRTEASRKRDRSRSRDREADLKRSRHSRSISKDRQGERSKDRRDSRGDGRDVRRDDRDSRRDDRENRRENGSRQDSRKDDSRRGGANGNYKQVSTSGKEEPEQQGVKQENGAVKPKAEPLSLEEILRKKEQEKLELAKPKFLSKKQREELALKRREDEVVEQRRRAEELRKAQQTLLQQQAEAQRAEERRRDEARNKNREVREREKELEMIKQQYLGGEKVKKKMLKPSEKFKFNFDWGADQDTSRDLNPLYQNTHEAALLFGRGLRAGVDRREQKKAAAALEQEMLKRIREAQGIKETRADRQRDADRAKAADEFDAKSDAKSDSHWSRKAREDMTERDWRIFREDFNISYKGALDKSMLPLRNWEEANLPKPLMQAIERNGYKLPSPIQMAAIPLGLKFRDVIGVAETGSGKTAAFVLPMLVYIMKLPVMTEEVAAEGPYAVVLAPTRELTQQIEEETIKLAHFTKFRMVSVVGGQNIEEQGFKLRKGCEIILATPGRLIDCLEKRFAVLNQCNYVVMDEADRMIDMGFEPQVMAVLDAMPSTNLKPESEEVALEEDRIYRTTYMFSATMPPPVERLARKYLRRPIVITIGSAGQATDNVTQIVYVVKENEKAERLQSELGRLEDDKRIIVFVNTKRQCDYVTNLLSGQGYSCTMLHGSKAQDQREASLAGFRDLTYNVLVATDVAGRGIDVPDVALVVNYDMPNNIENYTHRIGRTGRAGRKGTAITLLTMGDTEVFYDLKKFLEDSHTTVPSQLANHEAAKIKPGAVGGRDKVVYAKK